MCQKSVRRLTDEYARGTMGADQKLTALSQLCILMPLFAPAESIATEQAPRPADVHAATGESFGSCSSPPSPPPLSLSLRLSVSVSLRESGINPTLVVNLGLVIYVSPAVSRKCSRLQVLVVSRRGCTNDKYN